MTRVRTRVVLSSDGRITEGPEEIVGLSPDKVLECSKALDELARRRALKPAMLQLLYRRGWVTARGEVTPKGEKFRDRWRGRKWTTEAPTDSATCRNCGAPVAPKHVPEGEIVPEAWLDEHGGLGLCDRRHCVEAFQRDRRAVLAGEVDGP